MLKNLFNLTVSRSHAATCKQKAPGYYSRGLALKENRLPQVVEMGCFTARPVMAQEKGPFQFTDIDWAMDDAFRKTYETGFGEGVFLPFLAKGYFYRGAEVFHIMRVGGNEH